MTTRNLLIVLSSPSGGGKTTIARQLLARDRALSRSVSATTRPPRGQERDGQDYFFISERAFDRAADQGRFLEWATVHGHRYGTLKREIAKQHRAGRDVLLVIDVQGGLAVKQQDPRAVLIFVQPPSLAVLAQRLKRRNTDSRTEIQTRLRHARWERAQARRYDYCIVNQRLAQAVEQARTIISAERLRP